MGELLIVRHGQASFGSADYDRLSERGRLQAKRLATWLLAHYPQGFPAVVRGDMERHRETLEEVERAFADQGIELPPAQTLADLNEFDHRSVLEAFATAHPDHETAIAAEHGRSRDPLALFGFLRAGMLRWASGALDERLAEGWGGFCDRIEAGVCALTRIADERNPVLVVTSGGVMAQLARVAMALSPSAAVELNLTIRNCAISEFRTTPEGLRMASWNTLPHLSASEDRALWTYY
jgi:broad specificity phosphatase PhoE